MKTLVRAVCHEMQSHEQERIHMKIFIRQEGEADEMAASLPRVTCRCDASAPQTWYTRMLMSSRVVPFFSCTILNLYADYFCLLHYYNQLSASSRTVSHPLSARDVHNNSTMSIADCRLHSTFILLYLKSSITNTTPQPNSPPQPPSTPSTPPSQTTPSERTQSKKAAPSSPLPSKTPLALKNPGTLISKKPEKLAKALLLMARNLQSLSH
jgi:hypothetical protein